MKQKMIANTIIDITFKKNLAVLYNLMFFSKKNILIGLGLCHYLITLFCFTYFIKDYF